MKKQLLEKETESQNSLLSEIHFAGGELVVKLRCPKDILFPHFTGSIVRGAVLNFICEKDVQISSILHKTNELRSYVLSSLKNLSVKTERTKRNELKVKINDVIEFKIKILTDELLKRILKIFLDSTNPEITLLNIMCPVESVSYTRYKADVHNFSSKLKINFLSPTYFSTLYKSHPMLFPEPKYFFLNIAKIWNQFNYKNGEIPLTLLKKWIEENIVINDYKLQTKRVYIGKRNPILSMKGWVVYRFLKQDGFFGWIGLLSEYAKLCNVGGNRTAGMGEIGVKWIKEKKQML